MTKLNRGQQFAMLRYACCLLFANYHDDTRICAYNLHSPLAHVGVSLSLSEVKVGKSQSNLILCYFSGYIILLNE